MGFCRTSHGGVQGLYGEPLGGGRYVESSKLHFWGVDGHVSDTKLHLRKEKYGF